jgi:hypothetical protein
MGYWIMNFFVTETPNKLENLGFGNIYQFNNVFTVRKKHVYHAIQDFLSYLDLQNLNIYFA